MEIKIKFTDFWKNFEPENNYFFNFLSKYYTVTICDNPDYLFFSVYGDEHLKYNSQNCIKILFTGENLVPDFNQCDYAMGFHYIDFNDRYMRFPLYVIYPGFEKVHQKELHNTEKLLERKFCNFVYSNSTNADPFRTIFFRELSKYKKVDSGGRYLNNIGKPVANKMGFIKDYKFTIAFENSAVEGYTTEKIMEPMAVNSIPIYYGNPLIENDFNKNSFVNINKSESVSDVIEKIVMLDNDDTEYLKMLREPWINSNHRSVGEWERVLLKFFENIFTQEKESAFRRTFYGFNLYHTNREKIKSDLIQEREKKNRIKSKIKNLIRFNR